MSATYTISDLAREFDLTTRAIRFYEDMGLLAPQRSGPGGRQRVYTNRDRTRLKLTLRAKRLGLSLTEAKDIIDMYDSPRDTAAQLQRFLVVLDSHRSQLDAQMTDLQANLDEIKLHQREARTLLGRVQRAQTAPDAPPAPTPVAASRPSGPSAQATAPATPPTRSRRTRSTPQAAA